jgi:hypothetical protein
LVEDPGQIREWIVQAEADVLSLAEEAERAQSRLAEARRRLMLLYELLATVTNAPVATGPQQLGIDRSVRERVQADAEAILRERGQPMRVQDILACFVRRGMVLPGRGTPTNILAHLVVDNRFVRHARGVYGLSEWKSTAQPATNTGDSEAPEEPTKQKRDPSLNQTKRRLRRA